MSHPMSLRRRPVMAFLPALVVSWALAAGLPFAPTPGAPGRLERSTVVLTGRRAVPLPPAGSPGAPTRTTAGPARAGWSAAVDLDDGSEMVALTWQGDPAARVSLRSRSANGWSPWQSLSAEVDEGPDTGGNGRVGVGPVWLGTTGADDVEVRVISGAMADLVLDRMRWIEPTPGSGDVAGAEVAGPGIRPRSEWAPGGWRSDNPTCPPAPVVNPRLRFAVVHHTATGNDYTAAQVPGILAGIYRYHTDSLGWCDIAYNFLIDRFGQVWQGRSGDIHLPVQGGHAKGFNTDSVGVAVLGQHQPGIMPAATRPASAPLVALRELLAWKLSIHRIDPRGTVSIESLGSTRYPAGTVVTKPTIMGHRDNSLTSCPGDWVFEKLGSVRAEVAWVIAASATPSRWRPFKTPQALAARQHVDFLRRESTNSEQAYWASRMQRDGVPPEALVGGMMASAEFQDRIAPIPRLFLAYFGGIPDHAGLVDRLSRLHSGTSLASISDTMAGSTQFTQRYGQLSNAQFVRRVHLNVLGREPTADESTYWTGQLDRQALSRGAVMVEFSESVRYRAQVRPNVEVIMTTAAMLGRAPSPAGYASWVQRLQSGGRIDQLVAQNLPNLEYAMRVG